MIGLFGLQTAMAKVAYIPLFDFQNNLTFDDSIIVVDLTDGGVLKKNYIGAGVGPIFINQMGDKLFAAATNENKIVQIDTQSMEVALEWTNLPIQPDQIILNKNNNKLYFIEYNQDDVYQIDLINNQVSVTLSLVGLQQFFYSPNLDFLVFKSHNSISDEYFLHTYDLNNMSLLYQTLVPDVHPELIDNNGEDYYISAFGYGRIFSRSLINNQINWYFYHGSGQPGPIGELPEIFVSIHQTNENQILATGFSGGSYMIDTELGVGSRVNTLLNQYDNYENIEGLKFLKSNRPNAIICPPLLPCEDGYLPLQLVVHDHGNNTEELIFQKSNAGNLARGRYIGDKFYSVPAVPISSQWFTLALLGLLVIGCAFTFLNRKNASGEPS